MKSQVYQVELSQADYVVGLSALMSELARMDPTRGRLLFARLAVTIVTATIIGFAFPYSLPAMVVAALLIWLGDSLVRTAFKTRTVGISFDPAAHSNMRIEFSQDAVVEQGELRTRRWTWDAVRRVHLASGHVIVELKGWDMIVLPDRLWSTPEDRAAFVAELEARRHSGETREAVPSPVEAEARVLLAEPVLMARISLAVAAFHVIFQARIASGPGVDPNAAWTALALASIGAALMWWTSGKLFNRLARRSAFAALQAALGLFLLLATAFAFWFLGLI